MSLDPRLESALSWCDPPLHQMDSTSHSTENITQFDDRYSTHVACLSHIFFCDPVPFTYLGLQQMKLHGIATLLITHDMLLLGSNISGTKLVSDENQFQIIDGRIHIVDRRLSEFIIHMMENASDSGYRDIYYNDSALKGTKRQDDHIIIFSSRRLVGHEMASGTFLFQAANAGVAVPLSGTELMRIFPLTPAESHIAISIASGKSAQQIADSNGVSINTVRSHIRSIFKKTGTSGQHELISSIWSLAFI